MIEGLDFMDTGSPKGYLIFKIADKEFCIDIKFVATIVNPDWKYSEELSLYIGQGSIKMGDETIPVIDFNELFALQPSGLNKRTRIIIMNLNNNKAAFYVEQIVELITINPSMIGSVKFLSVTGHPFINCQIEYADKNILMPDFNKILNMAIKQN